ncbi:MAG: outer membrane beta-barrel protein [Flavobacteriaceae bacterium]|nr:outer membrane beta-barrel protein [Flavobacteriaceae bacterium]
MKKQILTIAMLSIAIVSFAQRYKGTVKDTENKAISFANVVLFSLPDSTFVTGTTTDDKGVFLLKSQKQIAKGYLKISFIGYETKKVEAKENVGTIILKESPNELSEIVVKGKALPKITATGEVFKLSQKAKELENPFRALAEIPLLRVDISNQSVLLQNGESPLILIDGRLVNSGIQPINPKDIESVEVSDVVSARYLKMGVSKIVNIRLRKERTRYAYTEFRTRHDVPIREGFGGANFEFGSSKFAVSGRVFADYLDKDCIRYESTEQYGTKQKILKGENSTNSKGLNGDLMLKWLPTPDDYLAVVVKARTKKNDKNGNRDGFYTADKKYELMTENNAKTIDGGMLTALYHEHTFSNKSMLTTFLKYNYGRYDVQEDYSENYDAITNTSLVDLATKRNQYTFSMDYTTGRKSWGELSFGNNFEYTQDNIKNQVVAPAILSDINLWSNYTYATYTNAWKRFYYMGSLGLEGLSVHTTDKKYAYWRPRASLSISCRLPHKQFIRGSYFLTQKLPLSRQLATFNQSINPWFKEEGNPYLVPMQIHKTNLSYNVSLKDFRVQVFGNHNRHNDIIASYIRNEGNFQIKSYHNNGTYKRTDAGLGVYYNGKNISLGSSGNYAWETFDGARGKKIIRT